MNPQPIDPKLVIKKLPLTADEPFIIRSLADHLMGGVATDEEVRALREFCDGMDQSHAG